MKLFVDENIIQESNDRSIILTTHRICQEERGFGTNKTKSIMLEHITSCESNKVNRYGYLLLSIIGIFVALAGDGDESFILVSFLLIFLGLTLYYLTRKRIIIIASPTSSVIVNAKKLKINVIDFIDTLEKAKHKRLLIVGNKN